MIRLAISNFFVSLLVMVCVCPLGSAQQPKTTASITIEVTDQTGAPIPGARARIVPYPHDISSSRLETNADGKLAVELVPGKYEVVARATAFSPSSKTFEIADTNRQTVKVSLRVFECSPCVEIQTSPRSADEEGVWKLENAYWKHVGALDFESYKNLWDPNSVAWRDEGFFLLGRDSAIGWVKDNQARGFHLEEFALGSAEIRITGNVAVTYYNVTSLWVDEVGRGKPRNSRFTHTWIRAGNIWRIVGEMALTTDR